MRMGFVPSGRENISRLCQELCQLGFGQGLNGRIVSKTVKPHNFSIPAKPGHLPLGILRGSGSRFRDGLLKGQLVIENRLGLSVANRLHRLGLRAIARCTQTLHLFHESVRKHLAGAPLDTQS